MFVTPVSLYEVLILEQHINPCHIFSAQYPKRYQQSSHCGPFEAKHVPYEVPEPLSLLLKGTRSTPALLIWLPTRTDAIHS